MIFLKKVIEYGFSLTKEKNFGRKMNFPSSKKQDAKCCYNI